MRTLAQACFGDVPMGATPAAHPTAIDEAHLLATGDRRNVRLTGYWPETATPAERKMEGPMEDRIGNPPISLQAHLADPITNPYVALACDPTIAAFRAYGQRVIIPELGEFDAHWQQVLGCRYAIARLVDTGGNFTGKNKKNRVPGYEPIDVNVHSQANWPGVVRGTLTIVPNDVLKAVKRKGGGALVALALAAGAAWWLR